ncbi:MAG: LuxR family transcriptional regulator [Methylococcaceae bacterium]|nr:MAG: LuxR family transcriptional regulator [Methylococcaceae bacterium]
MNSKKSDIHALWDELAELGSAARVEAGLTGILTRICSLINAQQAYWLGSVRMCRGRDPLHGWRPAAIRYLYPRPALDVNYEAHRRLIEAGVVDPSIVANVRGAGNYRINIHHELVPPEWFESAFYHLHFEPLEIRDAICLVTPLGEDIESWLGFERIGQHRQLFGQAERDLLDEAARPLKWFHRQIALHHGILLAEKPLTAAERRILNALLGSEAEKGIADNLGLTVSSVHTYATRIYRKFNVKGRTGLMALWLQH